MTKRTSAHMRPFSIALTLLFPLSGLLMAQHWEVGASGGYSLYRDTKVSRTPASGETGFESGAAFGGLLGNDLYRHVGGEVRYTFIKDDLMVSSGSTKATAVGQSHALHYDVLIHATGKTATVRPFVAVGAGVKFFRGTGAEPAFQPLSNLVVLTHTSQALPLISAGAGVKFSMSRRALVRIDFRDYITPFPDKLLATPPTGSTSGWIHNFVIQFGVSTVF
jgi:hypothetical protein